MKTIAIANQKGGIGKTTTACATASILAKKGCRVLMIDTDMQCNTTDVYKAETDGVATIYDVVVEKKDARTNINDAIQHTQYGDIIASDRLLVDAETILGADKLNGLFRFQEALRELNGYDFVIIDTNPVLNIMLYNVLIAVDYIVVPVTTDRFGVQGLSQLVDTIISVKQRYNQKINIAGLLIVKYKSRTNLGQTLKNDLEVISKELDTKLFDTTIRESVKVQEAQALQIPLIEHASNSPVAQEYINYVDELLKGVN